MNVYLFAIPYEECWAMVSSQVENMAFVERSPATCTAYSISDQEVVDTSRTLDIVVVEKQLVTPMSDRRGCCVNCAGSVHDH